MKSESDKQKRNAGNFRPAEDVAALIEEALRTGAGNKNQLINEAIRRNLPAVVEALLKEKAEREAQQRQQITAMQKLQKGGTKQ